MRRFVLPLALLLLLPSCGDDSAPAPSPPPAPAKKAAAQISDDTFDLSLEDNGGRKTIRVGDRVLVTLKARAAEDSTRDFGWADPEIEGEAVRFVNRTDTEAPDRGDGGHLTSVYELRANDAGRVTMTIPLRGSGTPGVAVKAFSYRFTVVTPD
jgi:hypothetical protein